MAHSEIRVKKKTANASILIRAGINDTVASHCIFEANHLNDHKNSIRCLRFSGDIGINIYG